MDKPHEERGEVQFQLWMIISAKELRYLTIGLYTLLTCALCMINKSTSFLQWILFSLILLMTMVCAGLFFYRRAVEAKQWLAITLTEFFMILCGGAFFVAGSLEAAKIVHEQPWVTVPPLIASVATIIVYVYLNVKNHQPQT